VATNEGIAPIAGLTVNDAAPNFTSLTGAPVGACTAAGGSTGTFAYSSALSPTVSCGTAVSVPPGGSLQLDFTVRIDF